MKSRHSSATLIAAALLGLWTAALSEAANGPDLNAGLKSHFVSYGTNRVHYLEGGKGPQTLVLIHGWGGSTQFWREQVPVLRDKARLIVVDLPGHGQSAKPTVDYSMDFFARGVLAVLDDARVDRATLVGHSMGVVVLCRVQAMVPKRVGGLVAVDGALRRPKIDAEQAEQFVAAYRTPEYPDHVKKFVAMMFPNPGTEALRDWTIKEILATPQHVLGGAMDAMFKSSQAWDLQHLDVPLIVVSAKSPMWTAEYEAYAKSLSDHTDYQVMDGVGHFLMLEKPAEFNPILVKALEAQHLIR